jgi:hypothetical protein
MTKYTQIFNVFLSKIEDSDLPQLSENDQMLELNTWLDSALGEMEIEGVKIMHDIHDRDSVKGIFNNTLSVGEIEVIARYMVIAWYDRKINSLEHILLFVGTKEEKFTNQKDHLAALKNARQGYRQEVRRMIAEYGFKNNTYLQEEK